MTRKKSNIGRIILYLAVLAGCIVILYPYFVMFVSAAKNRAEIYAVKGTIFPVEWVWSNFTDIWTLAPIAKYFVNSIIVAGGATTLAILCGIPAASQRFRGWGYRI